MPINTRTPPQPRTNITADNATALQSFLRDKGVDPKKASAADVSRLLKTAPAQLQKLPLTDLVELAHADVESLRSAAKVVDPRGAPSSNFGQTSTAKSPLFARGMAVPGEKPKTEQQASAAPSTSAAPPNPLSLVPNRASYSINEFLKVGKANLDYLQSALRDATGTLSANRAESGKLKAQAESALADVASALVPDSAQKTVAHLGDVFGAIVLDKAKTALSQGDALRAQAAAFPKARDVDTINAELEELKGVSRLQGLAKDADFKDLYDTGYGTKNYTGGMLRPGSWNDKSQEASILKKLGGAFASFADLRAVYDENKGVNVAAKTAPLEKEKAASLAASQLAQLPQTERAAIIAIVKSALQTGDHALIAKKLTPSEAQAFATFAGPFHQARMLDELATKQLQPMETAVKKEIATAEKQLAEARGASKQPNAATQRVPRSSIERIGSSSGKIATAQQSLSNTQTRIVEVHNYNSGMSFWEAYFWISVLTPSHHDHGSHVTNVTNVTNVVDPSFVGGGGASGGAGASGSWGNVDANAAATADPTQLFTPLAIDGGAAAGASVFDHAPAHGGGGTDASAFTSDPNSSYPTGDPGSVDPGSVEANDPNGNGDVNNDTQAADSSNDTSNDASTDAAADTNDGGAAATETTTDAS